MLAGAGDGHGLGRLGFGLLFTHAAADEPLHLVVVQALLRFLRAVAGAVDRAVARRLAGVDHLHIRLVAPAVHPVAVIQCHQVHRPVIGQGVPGVHQCQQLVVHDDVIRCRSVAYIVHGLIRVLGVVRRSIVLFAALDDEYRTHDDAGQQHGGDDAVPHGLPVALLPAAFSFVIHSVTSIPRGMPPSRAV